MWPFTRGAACACVSGWRHHITPPGLRIHRNSPMVRALQSVSNVSSNASKSVRGFASRIQGCFRNYFLSAKAERPLSVKQMDKIDLHSIVQNYTAETLADLAGMVSLFRQLGDASRQRFLSFELPTNFSSTGRLNIRIPGTARESSKSSEYYSVAQDLLHPHNLTDDRSHEWETIEGLGEVLRVAGDGVHEVYLKRDEQVFHFDRRAVKQDDATCKKAIALLQRLVGDQWSLAQKRLYHQTRHIHAERLETLSRRESSVSGLELKTQRLKELLRSHENYLDCCFWLAKESVGWLELDAQQIEAVRKVIFSPDYPL